MADAMLIQTVLNRIENFKSFIFGDVRIESIHGEESLVIEILPRKNGKPECSACGRKYTTYDTRKARILRVSAALDVQSILPVCAPSGELSDGWGFGGMDALGDRKRTDDPPVQKHAGPVGPAPVLE